MRERPILFSGPMVRAILAVTKMQTRRAIKPQPQLTWGGRINWASHGQCLAGGQPGDLVEFAPCPYGLPGDRLWVRESFMDLQGTGVEHYDSDRRRQRYAFAADCLAGSYSDEARRDYGLKWKPSIHMPRAASRITLEITGVRVERLHVISADDAWAEGVQDWMGVETPWKGVLAPTEVHAFASLWESVNGAGSWAVNPWVWVVEFRRLVT
ncbi:hypothetical protein [Bordetella petrii]|uniref:hypothetical protein n=1 Tax=Bordetella petrii TaxID=94624 RepID=UPI00057625ED